MPGKGEVSTQIRNYLILAASLVFYAWGAPQFIFILLTSTVIDFFLVRRMSNAEGVTRKRWLLASLGLFAAGVFDAPISMATPPAAWLALVAYHFQIYCDFSGYSDMAIGLGRMMGFHFPENFRSPYVSRTITEFWQRWHITLSNFMRDYLYIPLGGNAVHACRPVDDLGAVSGRGFGPPFTPAAAGFTMHARKSHMPRISKQVNGWEQR